MFDVGKQTANLATESGWDVRYLAEVPSTNTWAKQHSDEFKKHSLVITSLQTAGRGRGLNQWSDATAGANLLSSWILPLQQAPTHLAVPRAGLAVYRALCASFPKINPALKAPNDIYLRGKKLAGLLLENVQQGTKNCLVVGIGLNVQQAPELTGPIQATALSSEILPFTKEDLDIFITALMQELTKLETTLNSARNTALGLDEQQELLYALNGFQNSEPYLQVLPDGSLKNSQGLIPWQSL